MSLDIQNLGWRVTHDGCGTETYLAPGVLYGSQGLLSSFRCDGCGVFLVIDWKDVLMNGKKAKLPQGVREGPR